MHWRIGLLHVRPESLYVIIICWLDVKYLFLAYYHENRIVITPVDNDAFKQFAASIQAPRLKPPLGRQELDFCLQLVAVPNKQAKYP